MSSKYLNGLALSLSFAALDLFISAPTQSKPADDLAEKEDEIFSDAEQKLVKKVFPKARVACKGPKNKLDNYIRTMFALLH